MIPILERRRYPRFAVRLPFRLRRVAGRVESQAGTLVSNDVSKTGLRFTTERHIPPGQSIEVELTLAGYGPGGDDLQILGTGYIVRAEESAEPGKYQMAAVFDELPSDNDPGWNQLAKALHDPPFTE